MAFKKAQWVKYERHSFEAIVQMLYQYRGGIPDRDDLVQESYADPEVFRQWVPFDNVALSTLSRLSPAKARWFSAMHTLALLARQHLEGHDEPDTDLAHQFMTAGEWACEELERYNLIYETYCGGSWTKAGRELLDGKYPK